MYYVHTDHLGSLNVITNSTGAIVQESSYDAWGNRRDPATLQNYTTTPTGLITDRGFTGHEHMDAFKLINMNGRIYEPALGRFLSPDPYVQAPDFTQSYNRYSYCMNNPLSFTDPTGYEQVAEADYSDFWNAILNFFYSEGGSPGSGLRSGNLHNGGVGLSWTSYDSDYEVKAAIDYRIRDTGLTYGNLGGLQNSEGSVYYVRGYYSYGSKFPAIVTNYDPGAETAINQYVESGDWVIAPAGFDFSGKSEEGSEGLREHAKFLAESGEKYFALTGEAFHNDLYWMQKNGTIRLTSNIGNNYLLRRSYNLVEQTVQSTKIMAQGLWKANMAYAVYDYAMTGINTRAIPSLGKGTDLFFTSVAVIPGGGWIVSGAYWITSMGFYLTTGNTLGEKIDQWTSNE